mmetsp:Transcript_108290/g.306179  ORF Transcript_108290/g.306179 Transcript_108290/m.306179 type:complete len:490 (+) Transcript_108290:2483-3952(+)
MRWTACSASSIRCFTTSTRFRRRRFADSDWKAWTRSRPASSCCWTRSSSRFAASAAPSARRPTSTCFRLTYFCASARAACASCAALSMRARTSPASSGGIVSRPMRKGASVSRIRCSTSSTAATRSWACRRIGAAAARDCASSTVRCALSSSACAASARDWRSSILLRTWPLRPATLPEMRRMVGASVACATRSASLVSRISAALMSCGLASSALASGSDIIAAFSQSISTPARRLASSPKSFSACRASSWSLRTALCSSSLACAASRRWPSRPSSSVAASRAEGAICSHSLRRASSSRLVFAAAPRAPFTARSVSRMALSCSSRSSSTASMASGAARIATFSASSSAAETFSSRPGSIASSFCASCSSLRLSAAESAAFRFAGGGGGAAAAPPSRSRRASALIFSAIARTFACLSVSPGRISSSRDSGFTAAGSCSGHSYSASMPASSPTGASARISSSCMPSCSSSGRVGTGAPPAVPVAQPAPLPG